MKDEEVVVHELQRLAPPEVLNALEGFLARRLGGGRIIDAGAGAGAVTERLVASVPLVWCVDISQQMLASLRGRMLPGAVPVRADLHRLPLADHSSDGAVLTNVLHLLRDWQGAIRELVRCVRPGGEVVVNLGSPDGGWPLAASIREYVSSLADRPLSSGAQHGPAGDEELQSALAVFGGLLVATFEERWDTRRTVRSELQRLLKNPFAWPPGTDLDYLGGIVNRRDGDIVRRFGALDTEHVVSRSLRLTSFRLG
ncbi:MAG: hypothetical protein QOF60_186 [Actinomycetota bacterium]|nr:hypothetical protein [Actinomycetota bacterium]